MINSITTKNFETHLDTSIDLHPGVNIIVGESDEGKSGIIRQIKWNSRNRPQGDSYRNDQLDPKKKEDKLKETQVAIVYKDSGLVTRARDGFVGGVNHYQIDTQEPLRALRTDVPDEVQDVTRMKDVNIQGQHPTEQYFLLADKPGQVAKMFNKVAGLTIMDKATADINSQVRTCNTEIKIANTEIKAKKGEIKDTEWVDTAQKLAHRLGVFKIFYEKKQVEYDTLHTIIYNLDKIDEIFARYYDGLDEALEVVSSLKKEKRSIDDKKHSINQLSDLISAMKSVDSQLSTYTDIDKATNTLKSLVFLKENIQKGEDELEDITSLLSKIDQNQTESTKADIELIDAQKEYMKIRREQECPTCGRKGI